MNEREYVRGSFINNIWEHIWEKVPIGNWSHHVGFILELCSKYEIISWHVAKGYVLQCFWSSRDSSTLCFNILRYLGLLQPYVQYGPLCPIYVKICQYPKISLLLAFIKKYVDEKQIYMLFCGKCWLSWNFVEMTMIFIKYKKKH